MLCFLTVLMAQNGSSTPPARSLTSFNVSLLKQNNRSIPKDGCLPAHLMSVKEKETKWVTHSTTEYRSVNWVTKQVNIFGKVFEEREWGKTLQTPEEKKRAMSHTRKKNQQLKEQQMDKAERLWDENKNKDPNNRLSMGEIADGCELSKTSHREII